MYKDAGENRNSITKARQLISYVVTVSYAEGQQISGFTGFFDLTPP